MQRDVWKEAGQHLRKGDKVSVTNAFRVRKRTKTNLGGILGVVQKGGMKGANVKVRIEPVVGRGGVIEETDPLPPGPYTTCQTCQCLMTVAQANAQGGNCDNCKPGADKERNHQILTRYRYLAFQAFSAMASMDRESYEGAIRELMMYHAQDRMTMGLSK